jgi:hypothetical protein
MNQARVGLSRLTHATMVPESIFSLLANLANPRTGQGGPSVLSVLWYELPHKAADHVSVCNSATADLPVVLYLHSYSCSLEVWLDRPPSLRCDIYLKASIRPILDHVARLILPRTAIITWPASVPSSPATPSVLVLNPSHCCLGVPAPFHQNDVGRAGS